ncbi:hypothetical protein [Moraxella bovis]|uniref:Uncharacterized protein n=1 Tax=Moraxella bovis TaxID=476 RepID=A0A378PPQ4_MORBO|nr:hypothetical protein [Moraxella bovis]STY90547.1 Uncharacterised protein [Moraxella bovis]
MSHVNFYRIHIKPHRNDEKDQDLFELFLNQGILGGGWVVDDLDNGADWQNFSQRVLKKYPNNPDLNVFLKHMPNVKKDDLILTKDRHSNYYLAKVISGWEYVDFDDIVNPEKLDIHSIVRVEFQKIPNDIKGGEMYEFFNGKYRNHTLVEIEEFEQIYTKELYKYLWNKLSNTCDYAVDDYFLHMVKQIKAL